MKVLVRAEGTDVEVRCLGTGAKLYVSWLDLSVVPGQEPMVRCGLMVDEAEVEGKAVFHALDPEVGFTREVKAIEWADGGRTEL